MLSVILIGILVVLFTFYPTFILANKLEIERSDFKSIIIAVLLANLASGLISPFIPGASNEFLAFAYSILISGFTYTYTLNTDFKKALLLALIPALFWYIFGLLF